MESIGCRRAALFPCSRRLRRTHSRLTLPSELLYRNARQTTSSHAPMVSEAYQPRPQHGIGETDVDAPARQGRGPVTAAPASVIPARVAAAREESRVFAVFP